MSEARWPSLVNRRAEDARLDQDRVPVSNARPRVARAGVDLADAVGSLDHGNRVERLVHQAGDPSLAQRRPDASDAAQEREGERRFVSTFSSSAASDHLRSRRRRRAADVAADLVEDDGVTDRPVVAAGRGERPHCIAIGWAAGSMSTSRAIIVPPECRRS